MIYDNVKTICEKRGISIAALEREIGFARSTIQKWNENEPGVRKVQKVADFLGVPMEELLEDEPAKEVVLIQKY